MKDCVPAASLGSASMSAALPPPRLAVLENLSHSVRFRLTATLMFVALVYGCRFHLLQRSLNPPEGFPTRDDRRILQLRRRFIAGAAAGYLASTEALSLPFWDRRNFIYADLCAFWSNCLIAADATMDMEGLSLDEVRRLFGQSFNAMFMKVEADLPIDIQRRLRARHAAMFGVETPETGALPAGPRARLRRYTLHMAAAIGERISRLLALNGNASFAGMLDQFYSRTLDLMAGQLETYDQSIVDDEHDWGWYRYLMHNKFMNVLLAPIGLFANPAAGLYPEEQMRRAFHLLNRNFFHRQVLDDLTDFDEDLANGVANTLIYILVGQGRLASVIASAGGEPDQVSILRELDRSGLLVHAARGFDDDILPDRDRESDGGPPNISSLARDALKNRSSDASTPLEDLVGACLRRRAALFEAWSRRDQAAVKAIVEESGVANRVLDSVTAGTEQRRIEDALKRCLERSNIQGFVYTYYVRTLRTYEKCVSKWQRRAFPIAQQSREPARVG